MSRFSLNTTWRIRGGKGFDSAPFLLFGIVNATPDSFYDKGRHWDETGAAAAAHARALADQGAEVLDVGGESTRPGAEPVDAAEEWRRLEPALRALLVPHSEKERAGSAVSVDTYRAETAAKALDLGVDIINDVSACSYDPALPDVLVQHQPGYVLMHGKGRPQTMQHAPEYENVLDEVAAFFEAKLAMLVRAGVREDRILLDPGIGFGKTARHNLTLLANLERFAAFGRPLLVGVSNKSIFGHVLGLGPQERGAVTQVAAALAFRNGAWAHRVHDVQGARRALTLARALEDAAV